ncbi:MAG: hypothetical protein AAFZ63_29520, partial [Bacteroidota bacterium]
QTFRGGDAAGIHTDLDLSLYDLPKAFHPSSIIGNRKMVAHVRSFDLKIMSSEKAQSSLLDMDTQLDKCILS